MTRSAAGASTTPPPFPRLVREAPSAAAPSEASGAEPSHEASARKRIGIERHLDRFFDTNGDRMITLGETFGGLRRLGIGYTTAGLAALAINVGLGRKTGGTLTTVNLDNIAAGKHAGDSDMLDAEGKFVEARFHEVFAQHGRKYGDAMTWPEVSEMMSANADRDQGGAADKAAALGEFGLLFRFAAEPHPQTGEQVLTKDTVYEFYNGDLFDKLADRHQALRDERSKTLFGQAHNAFNTLFY